jgi:hypothetical protein
LAFEATCSLNEVLPQNASASHDDVFLEIENLAGLLRDGLQQLPVEGKIEVLFTDGNCAVIAELKLFHEGAGADLDAFLTLVESRAGDFMSRVRTLQVTATQTLTRLAFTDAPVV